MSKNRGNILKPVLIFFSSVGVIISIIIGLNGFQYWYGGLVISLWLLLGLKNYQHRTTLWLAKNDIKKFLKFYIPLLVLWIISDQFGLATKLWRYPKYDTLMEFLWVYLVLYSFAAFAVLETIYFLSGVFGEKLRFVKHKMTSRHIFIDKIDHFFLAISLIVAVISIIALSLFHLSLPRSLFIFIVSPFLIWALIDLIRLKFHVGRWKQYILVLITTTIITVLLHEIPNTRAFEWVYLEAPFLNYQIFGIPLWVSAGWFWWTLLLLRMWIFLILHPKIK